MAVKDPIIVAPYGMQWHVFAAFGEFCTPFLLLQIKFKLFSFINFELNDAFVRDFEGWESRLAHREMYCM